jgi:hypothetical protein
MRHKEGEQTLQYLNLCSGHFLKKRKPALPAVPTKEEHRNMFFFLHPKCCDGNRDIEKPASSRVTRGA